MATGTVKWFNPEKGYGFIQPDGGGKDAFVHIRAVERAGMRSLNEGRSELRAGHRPPLGQDLGGLSPPLSNRDECPAGSIWSDVICAPPT